MYQRIYGIWDVVALDFAASVFQMFPGDAPAARMFSDVIKAGKSAIAEHPADFVLVCVGEVKSLDNGDPVFVAFEHPTRSPVLTGMAVRAMMDVAARDAAQQDLPFPKSV